MMIGNTLLVKMAEYAVTAESYCLKTTLGSCVGVVLHDPARRITGLAHIMLPNRLGSDPKIGKFADTAIPRLLQELQALGIRPGPIYRDILNVLRYARLDGKLASREEEERYVRRRFAPHIPAAG